jgi:hypothetical protein
MPIKIEFPNLKPDELGKAMEELNKFRESRLHNLIGALLGGAALAQANEAPQDANQPQPQSQLPGDPSVFVKLYDGTGHVTEITPDLDAIEAYRLTTPSTPEILVVKVLGAILHTYINYLDEKRPEPDTLEEFDNARTFLRTAVMWAGLGASKEV